MNKHQKVAPLKDEGVIRSGFGEPASGSSGFTAVDPAPDGHENRHPDLMDTFEAALYLRLSRSCLAKWRCAGGVGRPDFILAGRKVLYSKATLDAWLASRSRRSTADRGK